MASSLVWGVLEGMMVSLVLKKVLCMLVQPVEQMQEHHKTFVEQLEAHHNLTVVSIPVSGDEKEHYTKA